jgi:hypothetical protein
VSLKKTYIDSGVLITAFRGADEIALRAIQILDDPDREFAVSEFVKLEVLPKAIHGKRQLEVDFYETFFTKVSYWAEPLGLVVELAFQQASTYGLATVDALHVAAALIVGADELVTTEKLTKPIHRVTGIQLISIAEINTP